uniref:TORTIFOLIA1/SINE1-2 N-terminal domain-containing protein n=1 Tax=Salix viminalis TaxID=40686 RepID=A0A6N2K175_SALVM
MSPPRKPAAVTSDLKHRVITCLNKLSDRDTLSVAATELESIAKNLTTPDSFLHFLNCIHNTDSSSKSPVRKQCVCLLTLLSRSHGNSLSPHLSKMISTITRRLRDPDSAVRSACVEATSAMSSQITDPPFSTLSRPFIDLLTVDQDFNAQIGAALCLAAAIEAAPEPEVEHLRKVLPRLGKLVKGEGFKAKAALLSLIGSIVGVGGASSKGLLDWLVPCLVEFLSSEDWTARKAAAEALGKVASMEKKLAREHKAACLTSLESRRFDKVKVVRETMNRTLELWKEVPSISEEISVPSQSTCSSTDNAVGICISTASKNSKDIDFKTPLSKKTVPANRSPPPDASFTRAAKKQSPAKSNDGNSKTGMFHKLSHDRHSAWKIEIASPQGKACGDVTAHDSGVLGSGQNVDDTNSTPETKRVLFSSILVDKRHKYGGLKSGSRVVPIHGDGNCYSKDVEVSGSTEDLYEDHKDYEDLSLIREQLVQIENQQSSLLDLLQRFIGSSQSGINSLETRVQGLEMAVNEISNDLAVSSGRIPKTNSVENTCCKLPGAEFLSSKLWRRTECRSPTSRFSSSGNTHSLNSVSSIPVKNASIETYNPGSHRSQHQSRGGFVVNTLADVSSVNRQNPGLSTGQMENNTSRD